MTIGAYDGDQVALSFSIQAETFSGSHTWLELGMCRTKGLAGTWETSDSTADSTADSTTTVIATRRNFTISADGVSRDEALYNQLTLKNHWFAPGVTTTGKPKVWLKLEAPTGEVYSGPFMITSANFDHPHKDVATWSIEATSNGAVTYDDGVA